MGVSDSLAAALKRQLLTKFPATSIPTAAELPSSGMTPLVAGFLQAVLDRHVVDESNRISYDPSEWIPAARRSTVDESIREARRVIGASVAFPESRWEYFIGLASEQVCRYLVSPIDTVFAYIFPGDSDSVSSATARKRLRSFGAYSEILDAIASTLPSDPDAIIRRMEFRYQLDEVARDAGQSVSEWDRFAEPLFSLHEEVNGARLVPSSRLTSLAFSIWRQDACDRLETIVRGQQDTDISETMLVDLMVDRPDETTSRRRATIVGESPVESLESDDLLREPETMFSQDDSDASEDRLDDSDDVAELDSRGETEETELFASAVVTSGDSSDEAIPELSDGSTTPTAESSSPAQDEMPSIQSFDKAITAATSLEADGVESPESAGVDASESVDAELVESVSAAAADTDGVDLSESRGANLPVSDDTVPFEAPGANIPTLDRADQFESRRADSPERDRDDLFESRRADLPERDRADLSESPRAISPESDDTVLFEAQGANKPASERDDLFESPRASSPESDDTVPFESHDANKPTSERTDLFEAPRASSAESDDTVLFESHDANKPASERDDRLTSHKRNPSELDSSDLSESETAESGEAELLDDATVVATPAATSEKETTHSAIRKEDSPRNYAQAAQDTILSERLSARPRRSATEPAGTGPVPLWKQFHKKLNEPIASDRTDSVLARTRAASERTAADHKTADAETGNLVARAKATPEKTKHETHRPARPIDTSQTGDRRSATATVTEPTEESVKPLWLRYQAKNAQPATAHAKQEVENLSDIERRVFGRADLERRNRFVNELFDGSVTSYTDVLLEIDAADEWSRASNTIAHHVFRRYRINIYSDVAVTFTNAVEQRFLK